MPIKELVNSGQKINVKDLTLDLPEKEIPVLDVRSDLEKIGAGVASGNQWVLNFLSRSTQSPTNLLLLQHFSAIRFIFPEFLGDNQEAVWKALKPNIDVARRQRLPRGEIPTDYKTLFDVLVYSKIAFPSLSPSQVGLDQRKMENKLKENADYADIQPSPFIRTAFATRLFFPDLDIQRYLNIGMKNAESILYLRARDTLLLIQRGKLQINFQEDSALAQDLKELVYIKTLYPGYLERDNLWNEEVFTAMYHTFKQLCNKTSRVKASIFGMHLSILSADKAEIGPNGIVLTNRERVGKTSAPLPEERSF